MRFSYKDYDKVFPREEKKKVVKEEVDPEDVMTNDIKTEEKEEVVNGDGAVGKPDTE